MLRLRKYIIISYLVNKHNARMVFDPLYPDIAMSDFKAYNWKEFYGQATESFPLDVPPPLGKEVDIRLYVDLDHARDKYTRRSPTGYFISINSAPIIYFSNSQPTVETSVFVPSLWP